MPRLARLRPRMLLTGSTPIQVGSRRTIMRMITSASALEGALTEMGYDVDWRAVIPPEDLSGYAATISIVNKPVSIASHHFYGALWALRRVRRAVAAVDDWQTREIVPGARTASKSLERAFRIFQYVDEGTKPALYEFLKDLAFKEWPWPVLAPTFEGGDYDLLEIPGRVVPYDPTPWVRRYEPTPARKERTWVRASLLLKDDQETRWPVAKYGNAGKARGGVGRKVDREPQPRVTEEELMAVYCRSWGLLSPPHPHAGSGWWRVRFLMSADAGCVISCDEREAAVLGEPYARASRTSDVEGLSDGMLRRWARDQRGCLAARTWTRERVKDTLADLLRGCGPTMLSGGG